jgi:hypothetical protein
MPSRRRALVLAVIGAALALAGGVWLLWPEPHPSINRGSAAKIQAGMTPAEVEAILGGPPRDDRTAPTELGGAVPDELQDPTDPHAYDTDIEVTDQDGRVVFSRKEWQSNRLTILVDFGADGRVTRTYCIRLRPVQVGPFDRLRRWIGL